MIDEAHLAYPVTAVEAGLHVGTHRSIQHTKNGLLDIFPASLTQVSNLERRKYKRRSICILIKSKLCVIIIIEGTPKQMFKLKFYLPMHSQILSTRAII